jgi:predicted acyltransferase
MTSSSLLQRNWRLVPRVARRTIDGSSDPGLASWSVHRDSRVPLVAGVGRLVISRSAQLAAEEGRDPVRRWALVAAALLIAEWTTITAEPRAVHHLFREREDVFR